MVIKRKSFRATLWKPASYCKCSIILSDGHFSCVTELASKKVRVRQRQNTFDSLAHIYHAEVLYQKNGKKTLPDCRNAFPVYEWLGFISVMAGVASQTEDSESSR